MANVLLFCIQRWTRFFISIYPRGVFCGSQTVTGSSFPACRTGRGAGAREASCTCTKRELREQAQEQASDPLDRCAKSRTGWGGSETARQRDRAPLPTIIASMFSLHKCAKNVKPTFFVRCQQKQRESRFFLHKRARARRHLPPTPTMCKWIPVSGSERVLLAFFAFNIFSSANQGRAARRPCLGILLDNGGN